MMDLIKNQYGVTLMHGRRAGLFEFAVVSFVLLASSLFADGSADLQRNLILETHPVSWYLFGANVDVEINTRTPNSIALQYQHYGTESPLNSDLEDDPEQPETFSGNNYIIGVRRYRDFAERGLDSFYYGIALDYLSVKYTNMDFYTGWTKVSTELTGIGPRIELGWRWIWPSSKITMRLGFFASYLFLDISQDGYPAVSPDPLISIDEDKDIDADSAQMFAGMIEGIRGGMEFSIGLAF